MTTNVEAENISQLFEATFGRRPSVIATAPGRIEFVGNHTDYNGGLVLGAAIDRSITTGLDQRSDRVIRIHSIDHGDSPEIDLDNIKPLEGEYSWLNYSLGVLNVLLQEGLRVDHGFDLLIESTLPVGAGLSSSAALELSTAYALTAAYGGNFDREALARVCRRAENEFVGVPCGILDQGVSSFGKKNHLVLVDARNESFDTVPISEEIRFWIFNSHHKHSLVESLYATRFRECMEARDLLSNYYDIEWLSDLSPAQVQIHRVELPDELYRRALHITEENERVKNSITLLADGKLKETGNLLFASHESSRVLFENSTPELDFMVNRLRESSGVFGARLTGGGFGGAVMAMTDASFSIEDAKRIADRYEEHLNDRPDILYASTSDGARVLYP